MKNFVVARIFACVPAVVVGALSVFFSGAFCPAVFAGPENCSVFRSEENGAFGLMDDESGRVVVPAIFDEIGELSQGFRVVRLGDRYGYVSAEGLHITPVDFRTARKFTTTQAGTPFASVRRDNGWNFIDERGVPVFPQNRSREISDEKLRGLAAFYLDSRRMVRADAVSEESFRDFAQTSVNNNLSFWYPKKEYETTQDWRARTTDEKLQLKIEELQRIAAARFVAERGISAFSPADFKLQRYDADNSTFLLTHKAFGALLVPMPRKEAAAFRAGFPQAQIVAPDYGIGKNDRVVLRGLRFIMPDGAVYNADPEAIYEETATLSALEIRLPGGSEAIEIPPRSALSDVDRDVPVLPALPQRPRFACILVNETYENAPNVLFAGEDGYAFEKYCRKTLGIPPERILRSKNNSLGHMRTAIADLAARAKVFPDAEIIFFYVGNSVADRYGNEYLLPTDCRPRDGVSGGLKIKELYEELGAIRAKLVTVFLDAEICKTGVRAGEKGVPAQSLVELSDAVPAGNSVVFRAARSDEIPCRFSEKSHGLFTYFLLKKIKETRGNVSYEELADYLETQVKQTAVARFNVRQTATATPSEALGDAWSALKMR